MEIYLVRHTETVCEKGVCYGQSDVGLLEPYNTFFDAIIKELPVGATLYSSPLLRCRILAEHLREELQIDLILEDERLMEMNFGDWELKKWDDIPLEDLNPWMDDFVTVKVPSGESFTELHARVVDFMTHTLDETTQKPIVIVTHAGVIRSFLCAIYELPLQDAFVNKINFGAVVKVGK